MQSPLKHASHYLFAHLLHLPTKGVVSLRPAHKESYRCKYTKRVVWSVNRRTLKPTVLIWLLLRSLTKSHTGEAAQAELTVLKLAGRSKY